MDGVGIGRVQGEGTPLRGVGRKRGGERVVEGGFVGGDG